MLALLLVVGLVVTVTILAVGVVLYGTLGFVGWALIVVGLGAALQFGLRRRGMLHRQDRERRSFLRLYPPLLVAIALVAMAIVVNIGPGSRPGSTRDRHDVLDRLAAEGGLERRNRPAAESLAFWRR